MPARQHTKEPETAYHTVKTGETVQNLSARYGLRAGQLHAMNRHILGTGSQVYPGMRIRIR